MEDHQPQTISWTEKSFPPLVQHYDRIFESKPEYAVQMYRRDHTDAEKYVRTPATLDECMRHFIRHVLFDVGGNFGNHVSAQARLNYMDDRCRQLRHDFKVLYHSHPSPNSCAWTYFTVRMMLARVAVATVSRRAAILFAPDEYELMKRVAGCYDYLLPAIRGNWQPSHAPIVALMVLHLGMRSTLNVAASPYWCLKPTVEDPSAVYQLEQPTAAIDLATAFQAVPPEAGASRDVQNSLLLLQALHAGEWFRFAELLVGLNLSFFQKCYAVSFLPFVRFRAVADTFGRPRKTGESVQKARLCDPVDVSYLTEKLLFANEDDCRSFLNDCGVVMANAPPNFNSSSSSYNNNNTSNLVIYMQGTHPQQNQQQPSPTEMFDRLRSRKILIDDSPCQEYGIYLPHPDFLDLKKARINSTTPGQDDSNYYDDENDSNNNIPIPNALMLIQQPDSLESNNSEVPICGSLSEWMQSVRDDVDHGKNAFNENSWSPLRTFAPSMTGVDVSAALVNFDRLIDQERSRLAARRVAVLGDKLLADFRESVVIPLDELYLTEMRVFSSQEQRERRELIEKLREQKKRKDQEEKSRKENEIAQKEKEQQQQQLEATKPAAAASAAATTQQKPGLFSSISSSKKLDELDNSDGAPKIPTNSASTSGNPFASTSNINTNNQNLFSTTKTPQESGNPFAPSAINTNKSTAPVENTNTKNPFVSFTSSTTATAAFATTKVDEKPAASILHHQEQQHHGEKHVHFEPTKNQVVVFSKEQSKEQHEIIIQTPKNHTTQEDEEQKTLTFPYIDDRGYYSWLPNTIDQLKKMWATFHNNNHHDSSTFIHNTDSFFFPEYSKIKNNNQKQQQQDFLAQQQRRVETDSVHLKIAVITPLDSVNPPSSNDNNNSSFDYYRTLTAATTSLFYDADSSDRESRLLCQRTFVNGDLVEIGGDFTSIALGLAQGEEEVNDDDQNTTTNTMKTKLEEFERICNSPTFSVSAYNIPWNRSLELCSMLNCNINNNNNNIKPGGGGVLAVLVLPEFSRERNEISEKFQNERYSTAVLQEFDTLINDFFSSFLRQEKFVTGKERKNGGSLLYPRGVVLLANINSDDEEVPSLFQECFERKWEEFRVKFAEMNRILNENHHNNSDKMLLHHHQTNNSNNNKNNAAPKTTLSRQEKLDSLRRQRNWQDSSIFWNNFDSNNDNNNTNALSEDCATTSVHHVLPPAVAPPMIIIPTKDKYVRATLGSAISDSMKVVMKEIRTRQIEKIY